MDNKTGIIGIKDTFENKAVGHILEMVMLDSRKHIAICQTAIEVL